MPIVCIGAPHFSQNLLSAALSAPHLGHTDEGTPCERRTVYIPPSGRNDPPELRGSGPTWSPTTLFPPASGLIDPLFTPSTPQATRRPLSVAPMPELVWLVRLVLTS
jgi:hypothetical protein